MPRLFGIADVNRPIDIDWWVWRPRGLLYIEERKAGGATRAERFHRFTAPPTVFPWLGSMSVDLEKHAPKL